MLKNETKTADGSSSSIMSIDTKQKPEILQCRNLSKYFKRYPALENVSFSVYSGEILGIIGPNGAGKTTLMECLAGLLPYDQGVIAWENLPLAPHRTQQFMFYLPDEILPYAEQRVASVIVFFQQVFGATKTQRMDLVDQLELSPVMNKTVAALSKGYRRRLLLLIGLLSPQPLLLLDEPFDGFDLRQTLGVMDLLREALSQRTLLLSIHQLTEAEKICDRFVLLNSGTVAAAGSLSQLRQQAGLSSGGLEEVFLATV